MIKELVVKILRKRLFDVFNNGYQNFERGRMLDAIKSIEELVPPDCFVKEMKSTLNELDRYEVYGTGIKSAVYSELDKAGTWVKLEDLEKLFEIKK